MRVAQARTAPISRAMGARRSALSGLGVVAGTVCIFISICRRAMRTNMLKLKCDCVLADKPCSNRKGFICGPVSGINNLRDPASTSTNAIFVG
eukprot:SAG11_NODE_17522_length_516_cov_0.613909_2_plen_92_part_01